MRYKISSVCQIWFAWHMMRLYEACVWLMCIFVLTYYMGKYLFDQPTTLLRNRISKKNFFRNCLNLMYVNSQYHIWGVKPCLSFPNNVQIIPLWCIHCELLYSIYMYISGHIFDRFSRVDHKCIFARYLSFSQHGSFVIFGRNILTF